jgi:hypothetical protein
VKGNPAKPQDQAKSSPEPIMPIRSIARQAAQARSVSTVDRSCLLPPESNVTDL